MALWANTVATSDSASKYLKWFFFIAWLIEGVIIAELVTLALLLAAFVAELVAADTPHVPASGVLLNYPLALTALLPFFALSQFFDVKTDSF